MTGWGIDYDRHTAESVYSAVQNNKNLCGFSFARETLKDLKTKLENLLFDAEWWSEKCEEEATHYEHMQQQLNSNPDGFSDSHARDVCRKSPQKLYDYVNALNGGASQLRDAIASVDGILKNLENAEESAKENGKRVTEKISRAIDLMDAYLRVGF